MRGLRPRAALEALLEQGEGESLSAADVARWKRPVVYIALDAQDQAVYVGVSGNGLERVVREHHHRGAAMQGCRFLLWWMPTVASARELERRLIAGLRPRANTQHRHGAVELAAVLGCTRDRAAVIAKQIAKEQAS